jgi:hypothetical protein
MYSKIKFIAIGNGFVGHNFLQYLVESNQGDN